MTEQASSMTEQKNSRTEQQTFIAEQANLMMAQVSWIAEVANLQREQENFVMVLQSFMMEPRHFQMAPANSMTDPRPCMAALFLIQTVLQRLIRGQERLLREQRVLRQDLNSLGLAYPLQKQVLKHSSVVLRS